MSNPSRPAAPAAPAAATGALTEHDFAAPVEDRYFEDYMPGSVYEYGYITVTEAEILDFARAYDPQPIHIDPDFAASGPFGGLIASGWHTAGIFTRLFVAHYVSRPASLASPGADQLRWPVPLRPGDSVHIRVAIEQARVSKSKPDRGIVQGHGQLINQHGQDVLRIDMVNIFARRPAA